MYFLFLLSDLGPNLVIDLRVTPWNRRLVFVGQAIKSVIGLKVPFGQRKDGLRNLSWLSHNLSSVQMQAKMLVAHQVVKILVHEVIKVGNNVLTVPLSCTCAPSAWVDLCVVCTSEVADGPMHLVHV